MNLPKFTAESSIYRNESYRTTMIKATWSERGAIPQAWPSDDSSWRKDCWICVRGFGCWYRELCPIYGAKTDLFSKI